MKAACMNELMEEGEREGEPGTILTKRGRKPDPHGASVLQQLWLEALGPAPFAG